MFIGVYKEDGSNEKEYISLAQVHSLNDKPILASKMGGEHSYPELATDLVHNNEVYAVTINMVDGSQRRIFEAGCYFDANSYILKFKEEFCVGSLDVVDYERYENVVIKAIESITKQNPEGATIKEIVEYIDKKCYDQVCIGYLAHTLREMTIHSRDQKLYFSGNMWDSNNRFRFGKEY